MTNDARARLAKRVHQRRTELGLTQAQLATAAGTTDRLIRSIERREERERHPSMLRAISKALGWTPDSIDRILAGEEPAPEEGSDEDLWEKVTDLALRLDEMEAVLRSHGLMQDRSRQVDELRRLATQAREAS